MSTTFLDDLRDAIAKGDDPENVAERACAFLRTVDRAMYNEALGHMSGYAELRRNARRGWLTPEQHTAKRKQSLAAFLDFLDEVERASQRLLLPFVQQPVQPVWPTSGAEEAIIGSNRLQSIAWLRQGLDVARSVCRITTSQGVGSGFLVGGGWLITNHHVVPSAKLAASAKVEFNVEENAAGGMQESYSYPCDASTWTASAIFDCAMVKTAPPGTGTPEIASWGALTWAPMGQVPFLGDHVSIIQHPSGGPKRVTISENQVVNLYEHRLQYTTDTMPGSSGSPVFDDSWRVVAVHHAGGNLVTNPRGDKRFINEGVLGEHVRRALGIDMV